MWLTEIYKQLKNEGDLLTGVEQQIQDLLDTNKQNLEDVDCLKLTTNRLDYFTNQHKVFNVLMEAVGDLRIMNSYSLLEMEAQLREEK